MAEEEEDALEGLEEDAEAFAEALSGGGEDEDSGDGEGDEDLDPLAEEMLKMMEEENEGGDELGSQEDVDRMMEMEMLKAMEDEGGAGGMDEGGGRSNRGGGGSLSPNIARLMDVPLSVTIVLGRTHKTLQDVLDLGEQSLVELDKQVGDPVDIMVNGKIFARGEVVTVSENFGVRITELVSNLSDL